MKKNSLDEQYLKLVEKVLKEGKEKTDRTGTGTISIFGATIRHDMSEGFPILTSKKMSIKSVSAELEWFLSGSTDIRDLWELGCSIWDGDFYKRYENDYDKENPPFSGPYPHRLTKEELIELVKAGDARYTVYADMGPIYGKQWRNFNGVDQIDTLIKNIKENPDSRRLLVSAWNPSELPRMILPPCHYGFQCYTRELTEGERYTWGKANGYDFPEFEAGLESLSDQLNDYRIPKRELSLMWNQRSVDTMLGLPYNIASYGLLLSSLCGMTNCVPGELIGNLGDVHIYKDQIPFVQKQLDNETYPLPTLVRGGEVTLINYQNAGVVKYPLSN